MDKEWDWRDRDKRCTMRMGLGTWRIEVGNK